MAAVTIAADPGLEPTNAPAHSELLEADVVHSARPELRKTARLRYGFGSGAATVKAARSECAR